MRYDVRVDPVPRECVWTADGRCVDYRALPLPAALQERVGAWVDRHSKLSELPQEEHATFEAWQDYDEEGRRLARLLKPALGPDAAVYYYREADEDFERVA